ncbi:MAG: 5-formyltetrahydrofolate cyclo-ligase [Pseudomonadota bacterium]|nr:5-formyltetrahydrofolate cyclo-ligase [Pseudomonadota bacterium]
MNEPTTADRKALRSELRRKRREIPAAQRIAAAESLASRLLELPFLPASGDVAGYWAMDGEIALHVFQLRLPPGLRYCLPVLSGDRLRFAHWRPGEPLATNRYGIPEPDVGEDALLEPSSMAMVLLPLVGFDARGHRLGMGGGWYDRSFAFRNEGAHGGARRPPWLVGAGFGLQQVEALDVAPWDVGLDAICSERDTILVDIPGNR